MVAMKKHLLITALLVCASGPLFAQAPAVNALSADEVMADGIRQRHHAGGHGRWLYREARICPGEPSHGQTRRDAGDGVLRSRRHQALRVVSEHGWKSAHKHVLHKMLASETETSLPNSRPKTRLVPQNYEFNLVGSDNIQGRPAYVLEAFPKRSDKYLFRGRVWVDAQDYAVVRIEGQPAKNPSFWIHSTHFVAQYQKSGPFWFPSSTTSVTDARIFGTTDVNIRYFDYRPVRPIHNNKAIHSLLRHIMSNTKVAFILAAGNGSRLAARSGELPKPLVRLHGKPLLEHVMRGAHQAGIERFVIVVGYRGHLIQQWWKNSPVRDLPVTWVENPDYLKNNGVSVLRAKPEIRRAISVAHV